MRAQFWKVQQRPPRLRSRLEAAGFRAEPEESVMVGRVVDVLDAETDDLLVCAAWLEVLPGTTFGGLWGGTTLPQWRRRGIYRALVTERAKAARSLGLEYLQVDASEDSRPILERLGMHRVATTTPLVWEPATW